MKTIKLALGLFIFAAVLFTVTSFNTVNDDQNTNEQFKKQTIDKRLYQVPTNG